MRETRSESNLIVVLTERVAPAAEGGQRTFLLKEVPCPSHTEIGRHIRLLDTWRGSWLGEGS